MIKKRAMANNRWVTDMATQWINEIDTKRLETGYADNQSKWPYWVKPCNYDSKEWDKMGDWVVKTFGNGDWMNEHGLWVGSDRKYWFRDERDRTLFLLKWS
jgi:hypothetical protein